MEYVPGGNLQELIQKTKLTELESRLIFRQIVRVLQVKINLEFSSFNFRDSFWTKIKSLIVI
jgi:serine/threonine protein kinase